MRRYVYAVIFDEAGNVLVFLKNVNGYFFRRRYIAGGQPLNGGGRYCFPGGALYRDEEAAIGAARELFEETRLDVIWYGVPMEGPSFTVAYPPAITYYGVFFRLPAHLNIYGIRDNLNYNLGYANEVANNGARAIETANWAICPDDNELRACYVIPIADLAVSGSFFAEGHRNTGWFYTIAQALRARLGR
jgi:8-oxo-dGTP pyrophosphatase MutT (NUDIX family)